MMPTEKSRIDEAIVVKFQYILQEMILETASSEWHL